MNLCFKMLFGSHLYGTNTPESDKDYKGVYIPSKKELFLGRSRPTISISRSKEHAERNTAEDVDQEYFSLARYLELLTQGQTVALDVLFGYRQTTLDAGKSFEVMHEIYYNRHRLISKNVSAFMGYARQQAAKYGIKGSRMDALKRTAELLETLDLDTTLEQNVAWLNGLIRESSDLISLEKTPLIEIIMCRGPKGATDAPHLHINGRKIPFHAKVKYALEITNKMLNEYGKRAQKAHLAGGVDWKALSHAVRVNSQAVELLRTGHITFPRPDRELLTKIKTGQLPYEQVAEVIEQGLVDVVSAQQRSSLPEKPDLELADEIILDAYERWT
jgi:hypothetical protein